MPDFATVTELEAFMGTSGLGARGTTMLGYASALIRREVGQDLDVAGGRQEEWAGMERAYLFLTETPVTAVSSVTIDAVAFTEFGWSRWGKVYRVDGENWSDGPIVVTYDSGYAASSDEMAQIKVVCLEVAARALAGPAGQTTYAPPVNEYRGDAPSLALTQEERAALMNLGAVAVG